MRFRRGKAVLAALAAAVALLPGSVNASTGLEPCTVIPTGDSVGTHVIVGSVTATGAVAIALRCGVVQNGVVVASFYTSMPGGVAAGAWTTRLGPGPYTACADVHAMFLDGTTSSMYRCP